MKIVLRITSNLRVFNLREIFRSKGLVLMMLFPADRRRLKATQIEDDFFTSPEIKIILRLTSNLRVFNLREIFAKQRPRIEWYYFPQIKED